VLKAQLGQKAPLLSVSDWVQGDPVNFDGLLGKVVLVEVFQVNCPGCFLYALPQAIRLHEQYSPLGLSILGIATAFEDFDKNNLENLVSLINHGEVIGETQRLLSQQGLLANNKLPYRIPFPVAMDKLNKRHDQRLQDDTDALIKDQIPNFKLLPESQQLRIRQQVESYLLSLDYRAETFERYDLKGTPSHILVDREGLLNSISFGEEPALQSRIEALLVNGNKL